MRLTHLGSSSPVSIPFVFICALSSSFAGVVSVLVHGRLSWFACGCLGSWGGGFMSWAFVIRAWGSSSSALSFVGAASSCVGGGARSRAVYIVRGWGLDIHGLWLSYTRGVRALWVIEEWGGGCFIMVSLWCVVLSSRCTVHMVATSPCW